MMKTSVLWLLMCMMSYNFSVNCFADEVGKLAVQSIKDAGSYFNFRCPLDAEFKIGKTWADTH